MFGHRILSLGNGEYRVVIGEPGLEPDYFYVDHNHKIRVATHRESGKVCYVEEKKAVLLRWLKNTGANKEVLAEAAANMSGAWDAPLP